MKNNWKVFCLGLLSCMVFAGVSWAGTGTTPATAAGYKINVTIKGVKNNICLLANYYGDKQYIKDTAKVDDKGHMVFEGKKALDAGIYLVVLPSKNYFEIILDKNQFFTLETDSLDFVKNMKVKDSEDNSLFYQYLRFVNEKTVDSNEPRAVLDNKSSSKEAIADARKKMTEIDKQIKDFRMDFIKAHPSSMLSVLFKAMSEPEVPEIPTLSNGRKDSTFSFFYYKNHYWDNVDLQDDRLLRTPIFHSKLENYFKNVVLQIPDSIQADGDKLVAKTRGSKELFKYTVWFLTYTYETAPVMGFDQIFVHLVDKYYTKDQATWVDSTTLFKIRDKARALKPLLLGKQAQPIILQDSTGKVHSLYDLKSKYTILLFWDPDCGHCQKAIPVIAQVYDSLKTAKFDMELMAVDGATEEDKWRKFIRDKKLKWINLADCKYQNNFRYEWDLKSYPQLYVLDKNKKIIAKKLAPEQIGDFLRKYDRIELMKEKEKNSSK